MLQTATFPIRKECPPGACVCDRDALLATPGGDTRILLLTREEEKKLIARIESISTHADLRKIEALLFANLGVVLRIIPSDNEVRTVRGFQIVLDDLPGLCSKTRRTVPAAVRKCLENNPEIVFAILNERDLLGAAGSLP